MHASEVIYRTLAKERRRLSQSHVLVWHSLLFTLAILRFHLFDIVTCSHSFHTLLVLLFYKWSLVPICNVVSYSYLNWKPAQNWYSDCCPVTLVAERMVFFELLVFITGACIPLLVFLIYLRGLRGNFSLLNTEGRTTANSTVTRFSQARSHQEIPVSIKKFNGDPESFRQWAFAVELALRSRNLREGSHQVDFVSMLLEGNALLWLIAAQDSGETFEDWPSLKNALVKTFGPLQSKEENVATVIFTSAGNHPGGYIQDFTRRNLNVSGLDEHSRSLLFVRRRTSTRAKVGSTTRTSKKPFRRLSRGSFRSQTDASGPSGSTRSAR